VVKAQDIFGNESQQTRRLLIHEDQAPLLSWQDGAPGDRQQRGQPLRGVLLVQDDFFSSSDAAQEYLLLISSLRGLSAARGLLGAAPCAEVLRLDVGEVAFAYPGACGCQCFILLIDKPYLAVGGDRMVVRGGQESLDPRRMKIGNQARSWSAQFYSRD